MKKFVKSPVLLLFGLLFCITNLKAEVDMYFGQEDLVHITFTPRSFEDPPGDVDDPLGCVFVDNLFLTRLSPQQIENGEFFYANNPEMNEYIIDMLYDLGVCSVYVFIEGIEEIEGGSETYTTFSEAASFNITGNYYQRLGSAQIWEKLEVETYKKFADLREARQIIVDNSWNFKSDLTFWFMAVPFLQEDFSTLRGEYICESCSSMEPSGFGGEEFDEEGVAERYSGGDLPGSFDWRNKEDGENWMTPAKCQIYVERDVGKGVFVGRECGSCYIMGALSAVEAFYNIEMKGDPDFDLDLSEQHGICEKYGGGNPCAGGSVFKVYAKLVENGILPEECCPYVGKYDPESTCGILCEDWESKLVALSGCRYINTVNTEAIVGTDVEAWRNVIKENLLETPMTFRVCYEDNSVYRLAYNTYSGGIFPLWRGCGVNEGGHVVALAGWGNEGGEDYWIVKNSLGPNWGDNGYVKMKMADDFSNVISGVIKPVIQPPKVGVVFADENEDSVWHSVREPDVGSFADPIVVMGPPSYWDSTPTTVRVKDVTRDSFAFQLDEWDYLDGTHGIEIIPYLIAEEGARSLEGFKYQAGKIKDLILDMNHSYVTVEFEEGFFSEPPIILTQVVTKNGEEAVVTRVREVTANSFKVSLQEEEGSGQTHTGETVHYIAISPFSTQIEGKDVIVSKTSNSVTDDWYTVDFGESLNSPVVLANMNTTDGRDPCALRYRNPSNSSIEVKIEEEQSEDDEVNHNSEVVGYIAISDVGVGTAPPEVPSNLNAYYINATKVHFTWVNNSIDGTRILIERKEGTGSFSQICSKDNEIEYRDSGLSPLTTYTYRLRAFNYGGYSEYSEELSVTTLGFDFITDSWQQPNSSVWHEVDFPRVGQGGKYDKPIVVMGPPSCNDTDPTTIRVKEVRPSSFKFQIDEWDYLDGTHGTETISYMVMERGVHNIDGEIWEADSILEVDCYWKRIDFKSSDFDEPPIVFTQVVTNGEPSAVVTRLRNVTTDGFLIRLQDQQSGDHNINPKKVHYIATEAKSGEHDGRKFLVAKTGNNVTDEWYNEDWSGVVGTIASPIFLAAMQTFDGRDPCALRYQNLTETSVEIKCEEEQSDDDEVNHVTEDIGFLVIEEAQPALSTFKTAKEIKEIYENYIKLTSPVITGSIILNISSSYDRKATVELIDIAGRVVKRRDLNLKKGRENLDFGQFKSGVYFLRIKSDETSKHEIHKITVLR